MSAQEFKVGQQVSGDDYARLPVGSVVECSSHEGPGHGPNGIECKPLTKVSDTEWDDGRRHDSVGLYDPRTLTHLGDGTHAEPEDKDDDLYVEPEPLKEGDWCLVWAEVQGSEWSDDTTPVHLPVPDPDLIFVPRDAIVRPDAGQVPPWVKPAQCTSLHEQGHYLARCTALGPHENHRDGLAETWTDAEAYGRVEVES